MGSQYGLNLTLGHSGLSLTLATCNAMRQLGDTEPLLNTHSRIYASIFGGNSCITMGARGAAILGIWDGYDLVRLFANGLFGVLSDEM